MRGSKGLVLTGVGGIALVGNALFRYTDFRSTFIDQIGPGSDQVLQGCHFWRRPRPGEGMPFKSIPRQGPGIQAIRPIEPFDQKFCRISPHGCSCCNWLP